MAANSFEILWDNALKQFEAGNYKDGEELCDNLLRDIDCVISHPDKVVKAGLWIAYNPQEKDDKDQKNAYKKGMQYFMMASACIPHPSSYEAMKHLGFMYQYGHGVAVDPIKELSLYNQSANGGSPDGCYCLGLHHYNLIQTNSIDLENLGKAKIWLDKAAELGYDQDSELTKKRIDCLTKMYQFHIAQQQQQSTQAYLNKLKQIQMGDTGNMAEQSGPEVVTPAETAAVFDSVALANLGSEKRKEEEKQEEVAPQPDNSAARALTGGAGTFKKEAKARSAANKTPSPSTDPESDGWTSVGRGNRQGRGRS